MYFKPQIHTEVTTCFKFIGWEDRLIQASFTKSESTLHTVEFYALKNVYTHITFTKIKT